MSLRNQVQLITYADSVGNNLEELKRVLDTDMKDLFGGVHILPFYPSSGDRGFAPLTHLEVEPKFGSWDDIRKISQGRDLSADLILNHISRESEYFKDFLARGQASPFFEMFAIPRRMGLHDQIDEALLNKVYRPRPTNPLKTYQLGDGTQEMVWCTFSEEQIDMDWESPVTQELVRTFIQNMAQNGVHLVRLDGVGYTAKILGSRCYMIPRTYEIIKQVQDWAHEQGIIVLCELHAHYKDQLELSTHVDFVYDFALPVLVLDALYHGDGQHLADWLRICPRNQITTLDTHDGLPVPDVEDLIEPRRLEQTTQTLKQNGGNALMRATGWNAQNVDIYQINCTYYSALAEDDAAYLLARAIQFFAPGIPQVYYVGALAGRNDLELLEQTNNGRDINRHYYTLDEIRSEVERPVVQQLFELIRLRNSHPVFQDLTKQLQVDLEGSHILKMTWSGESGTLQLAADLQTKSFEITESENGQIKSLFSLAALPIPAVQKIAI